jgi:hypothetical protein
VCFDFYGQLVEVARARREVLLVLALLGKHGNGGFGAVALVVQFVYWADIGRGLNKQPTELSGH